MTDQRSGSRVAIWLRFWFFPVSLNQLALLRVGVGLILLYTLFVYSFDLDAHFSASGWSNLAALGELDPWSWHFSVLDWFPNPFWLWCVHLLAILTAMAFLIGILPLWSAALSLVILISYGHSNPAVLVGLDSLLLTALFYLALLPSGRALGLMAPPAAPTPLGGSLPEEDRVPWPGLPLRLIQIHLCLIYFFSGLANMDPDWLAGVDFWHPRLLETGLPLARDTLWLQARWSGLLAYGAILFCLFLPVFVWLDRFRYWVLGLAVAAHLAMGVIWGKLPQNLLMIVLLLSFVRPHHVDLLVERVGELLGLDEG